MSKPNQFRLEQFIEAIPGTGGIVSTIARKVGCNWYTARKYIDKYATVKAAYLAECEKQIDKAEGVVLKNIDIAIRKQQTDKEQVDSADAKWYLRMKGKHRGYVERQEIRADVNVFNPKAFEKKAVQQLKDIADIEEEA